MTHISPLLRSFSPPGLRAGQGPAHRAGALLRGQRPDDAHLQAQAPAAAVALPGAGGRDVCGPQGGRQGQAALLTQQAAPDSGQRRCQAAAAQDTATCATLSGPRSSGRQGEAALGDAVSFLAAGPQQLVRTFKLIFRLPRVARARPPPSKPDATAIGCSMPCFLYWACRRLRVLVLCLCIPTFYNPCVHE
jgi:hypothetical protein